LLFYYTEEKLKYANGVDSTINVHTKFEVCLYAFQSHKNVTTGHKM